MPRALNQGCLQCKARHLKCDEAIPSCTHCVKSHRGCRYADPDMTKVQLPLLENRQQLLLLLKEWVEDTSRIMDPVDDQATFAHHVSKLALTSGPVLYAICAVVLFHHGRLESKAEPTDAAHELYMAAVTGLKEILHTDIATALFCTTILRVYQEYQGQAELQSSLHLSGAVALLHADRMRLETTDAAVFAILRQDLSSALARGSPFAFPWHQYTSLGPGAQSDADLANDMSLLLAHRIAANTPTQAVMVDERIASWHRRLPISFQPIEKWKSEYGRIVYLQSWHAIAMSTFHAAQLLAQPEESHALHIIRTALYSSHLGVKVHLCGMMALCKRHLSQRHHAYVDQVIASLEQATGFQVQMG
ncbi:hypothetical protein BCR37DRAFT_314537 [Protomyces lactucae-debilis]|uniref:Zn(2)-C6 fungal-type domain-containing protein n=1 Tax=Protomyces lactucae-debilis TaxID=2754530 RepID=A0A1Y2FI65_PROLT|nr:uncharacterized protein BCR37DRAFT_314537 [Protomyces lactucae-debilis]ORY82505.1 hypothetical protein BCR37DRAFT_314537 [Protomyces lactucae-debilis]